MIEVINTENEYFERVIFIVKNEKASASDPFLTKQATEFVQTRHCSVPRKKKKKIDVLYNIARYIAVAGIGAVLSAFLMSI